MRGSLCLLALSVFAVPALSLADVPQTFDKHYPIQGRAELEAQIGSGNIHTRSCGTCRDIHVHLEMNDADRSQYRLDEQQSGNHVRFVLKQNEGHWSWHSHSGKGPELTVDVPRESNLALSTGSGDMTLSGVSGDISMSSGSGDVSVDDLAGGLNLRTGSGDIHGNNLQGSLKATTGSGTVRLGGRFPMADVRTGSGDVELSSAGPDALRDGSHITTGSGSVRLRLSRDAKLNVHLSTGSGSVHSDLPLTMQGNVGDHHNLEGTLNGGGSSLRISTGSGDVQLQSL